MLDTRQSLDSAHSMSSAIHVHLGSGIRQCRQQLHRITETLLLTERPALEQIAQSFKPVKPKPRTWSLDGWGSPQLTRRTLHILGRTAAPDGQIRGSYLPWLCAGNLST